MKRWLHIITTLILMGASFWVGLCVKNWPLLELDPKIGIADVFTIFLTIVIAAGAPFFINYFIDRYDKVNEVVYNEIEVYRSELESIQERFVMFYQDKSISSENKLELVVWTEILDKKFGSLVKVVESHCNKSTIDTIQEIKKNQIVLWRLLTGSKIANTSYVQIDYDLFQSGIEAYQAIQESITALILKMTES